MSYLPEEIIQYITEEDVRFVRMAFRDAFGVQKNISVMPGELSKAFAEGIPVGFKDIAGFEACEYSNLYLRPDPETLSVLPWRSDNGKVVRMYCDVYTPDGVPYESDTRVILQKAVEQAEKAGIEFRFGNESEFYLFKKDDEGNKTKNPYDEGGYMDIAPLDRGENIRREICLTIEEMGLEPERSHHERGPGQNEIDFHFAKPVKAADQMTTFKLVVSSVADRNGLYADFSPVPIKDKPGNGYHINVYATDKNGEDVCTYAAAGIIDKIRDITLFMNPSEDSYARFGTGTAPDRINWSSDGHSELVYISKYRNMTSTVLRSPDALSNPYLAYALLIYAGLYGIENKLPLPKETDTEGAYLPQSRKEAIKAASGSEFVKKHIPEEIIKRYCR
ncbi:MAG: glutamine synthetase family protein [Lachnospiraceae bacterium]|nr:glutamine synthetase family protein [Lachnospiraceae bacterium]